MVKKSVNCWEHLSGVNSLITYLISDWIDVLIEITKKKQSAQINVQGGAAGHSTTNHACSSARNAAGSACVFPLVSMVTKLYALATTTGRPNKEDQNALDLTIQCSATVPHADGFSFSL